MNKNNTLAIAAKVFFIKEKIISGYCYYQIKPGMIIHVYAG